MPMGHFPMPISHIGNGHWEMAHWHMVYVVLLTLKSGGSFEAWH